LKTFANAGSTKVVKSQDKTIILKGDKNLFSHLILISQSRNLTMSDVFCHPLGPLPYELANPDGSIRKTNKSVLGREIFGNVSLVKSTPVNSAYIVDAMAMVLRLPINLKTFGDAADCLLRMILHDKALSSRVDVVFDEYRDITIKGGERERRGTPSATRYINIQAGHKIQLWKKFLSTSDNKQQLINFIGAEWQLPHYRSQLESK
jgi:hypothetical protein